MRNAKTQVVRTLWRAELSATLLSSKKSVNIRTLAQILKSIQYLSIRQHLRHAYITRKLGKLNLSIGTDSQLLTKEQIHSRPGCSVSQYIYLLKGSRSNLLLVSSPQKTQMFSKSFICRLSIFLLLSMKMGSICILNRLRSGLWML